MATSVRGGFRDDSLNGSAKEMVDLPLVCRAHGAMDIKAYVEDIDVADKAQRDLQGVVQDGPIFVGSVDAGEDSLDTYMP